MEDEEKVLIAEEFIQAFLNKYPNVIGELYLDANPDVYKECDHAKAHFHLGNQEQCRIPLKGPVAFSDFVNFIMLHFYDQKINVPKTNYTDQTISFKEQKMIHIFWE